MEQPFPAEDDAATRDLPAPDEWLDCYGDALYGYALDRLRRPHEAEDVVQETLLAALKARADFRGRAHPRTWLMGILQHKIVDRLRHRSRSTAPTAVADLDGWFDGWGHWRRPPARWDDPAAAAERSEFWQVVRRCLARLPPRMAEAFTLRTLDDCAAAEVCRALSIAPGNLWVLLHRARLQLVRCLEMHWFDAGDKPC